MNEQLTTSYIMSIGGLMIALAIGIGSGYYLRDFLTKKSERDD